jgi:hypothetical protein
MGFDWDITIQQTYKKLWAITINYPCLMGKSTTSMVIFNSELLNYQSVLWKMDENCHFMAHV